MDKETCSSQGKCKHVKTMSPRKKQREAERRREREIEKRLRDCMPMPIETSHVVMIVVIR